MDAKEVELQIIASIKTIEDLSDLRLKGLRTDDFQFFPNIYGFFCDHISKYESIPSEKILKAEFPELVLPETSSEETSYWIDAVINNSIRRGAESVLSRGIDLLQLENPVKAIDYIGDHLFKLKRTKKLSKSFTDRDALRRYDLYVQKRKKTIKGTPVGIKTGIGVFDEKLIGWNPGNLVLVVGFKGVGKSFLSLKTGIVAYLEGKKVLFLSPEMSVEDVESRWDSMVARHFNYEFSNESLVYGLEMDYKKYKDFLDGVAERSDWITADSSDGRAFDSEAIEALTDEYNPDLLVIDGLYLVRGDEGRVGDWSTMVTVSNKLKTLATRKKCVIVCTSQAADGQSPDTSRTAYSKYLSQPVDFMLWMNIDPENEELRRITVTHVRSGKRPEKASTIRFKPDLGIIG